MNDHLRILLNSIKSKNVTISFNSSDLGALTGYHPYANIVDLFLKYLYQHLDLLYEIDCQICNLEIIPMEEEMTRILSKCSKEKQEKILDLTKNIVEQEKNLTNHHQVKQLLTSSESLFAKEKKEIIEIPADERQQKEILSTEEIEFLENEIFFRIKTNYGKFNEEKALNRYETITGFEVVERNDKLYILEIPSLEAPSASSLPTPSSQSTENNIDIRLVPPNNLPESRKIEDNQLPESDVHLTTKKSIPIECIDLVDSDDDDKEEQTTTTSLISQNNTNVSSNNPTESQIDGAKPSFPVSSSSKVLTRSTITTTTTTTTTGTTMKAQKISEFFLTRSTTTMNSNYKRPAEANSTTSADNNNNATTTTNINTSNSKKKAKSSSNSIAFTIIGKVDGVSYQMDSSSSNANDWQLQKIIIEVKHRVQRIAHPPPLYEQIQLIAYLLMTGAQYGDLVQVMPDEGEDDDNNNNTDKNNINQDSSCQPTNNPVHSYRSPTFSISRIALQGAPYFHQYHWDTVLLPRLHIFKDAILSLRKDDDLRFSFLLGTEEERLLLIHHLCPYFQ